MYVCTCDWLIDWSQHIQLFLLSSYPIHPSTYTSNHLTQKHLFIQTYPPSSASTSYHQFPYYSPRTLHRLWDNTAHQWRLERDTCRRFCSLGRIDRWIFRRGGIGTGWGRWVSRRGEKKFIVCEKKKKKEGEGYRDYHIHEQQSLHLPSYISEHQ